jgi:hypothetical protein
MSIVPPARPFPACSALKTFPIFMLLQETYETSTKRTLRSGSSKPHKNKDRSPALPRRLLLISRPPSLCSLLSRNRSLSGRHFFGSGPATFETPHPSQGNRSGVLLFPFGGVSRRRRFVDLAGRKFHNELPELVRVARSFRGARAVRHSPTEAGIRPGVKVAKFQNASLPNVATTTQGRVASKCIFFTMYAGAIFPSYVAIDTTNLLFPPVAVKLIKLLCLYKQQNKITQIFIAFFSRL